MLPSEEILIELMDADGNYSVDKLGNVVASRINNMAEGCPNDNVLFNKLRNFETVMHVVAMEVAKHGILFNAAGIRNCFFRYLPSLEAPYVKRYGSVPEGWQRKLDALYVEAGGKIERPTN